MFKRITLVIVGLLALISTRPAAQQGLSAARLLAAYQAGDSAAISRTIRTRQDYAAIDNDLQRLIDTWKSGRPAAGDVSPSWSAAHAGFVLHVALVVLGVDTDAGVRLIGAARDLTTMRPTGLVEGRPDADDRFEVALHRAAISALSLYAGDARSYLDRIAGRVELLSRLPGGPDLTARLVLARGMVLETAMRFLAMDPASNDLNRGPAMQITRQRQAVIAAYEVAERLPTVAAEARIRRGLMLHRMGEQSRALQALDNGLAAASDPVVRYWGWIFKGRVLQATGQLAEARAAYEQAAALVPTAQTPAVALAAVLVQMNDRTGAEAWAAAGRAGRGGASDPWWHYWFADLRDLDSLLTQIRRPQ